jgi:hypothetical protein
LRIRWTEREEGEEGEIMLEKKRREKKEIVEKEKEKKRQGNGVERKNKENKINYNKHTHPRKYAHTQNHTPFVHQGFS